MMPQWLREWSVFKVEIYDLRCQQDTAFDLNLSFYFFWIKEHKSMDQTKPRFFFFWGGLI